MDDRQIIDLINSSRLIDDDKTYWVDILPKLSPDHKEELSNILTIKTRIRHAISEIDHALLTIEEAEKDIESDTDNPITEPTTSPTPDDLKIQYEQVQKNAPQKEDLERARQEELNRLEELRAQLKDLSIDSQGVVPPSTRAS